MLLKKPSQLFQEDKVVISEENSSILETFTETFDKFKENTSLVEGLKNKIDIISEEINTKITKSDLENAIVSHLLVVDESVRDIQSKIKTINKTDLLEFKRTSNQLKEEVSYLIKNQFPKYKKKIIDTEVKISGKFEKLKEEVKYLNKFTEENLHEKISDFAEVVDTNFSIFNEILTETKNNVNEVVDTYRKLQNIIETKGQKENERFDEYEEILENFNVKFFDFQDYIKEEIKKYEYVNTILDDRISIFENEIENWKENIENTIEEYNKNTYNNSVEFKDIVNKDISNILADISIFETHNKTLTNKIENFQENLLEIKDNLKYIEILENNQLKIQTKLTDNQNKLDRVEDYQLKIQTKLNDNQNKLDLVEQYLQDYHSDIEKLKEEVFYEIEKLPLGNIQENIYNLNKKLSYIEDVYKNIEPETIIKEVIGENFTEPASTKNVDPLTPLDKNFVTLDQLQQHYRLFINRIQQQISTLGGGGETRLKYLDDIVGIATNSSAYDGKYLRYNHTLGKFEFGSVTGVETTLGILNEGIQVGTGVTSLDFRGSGISTVTVTSNIATINITKELTEGEENIIYVAKDGNDNNSGTLSSPKLTIKSAVNSLAALGKTDIVIRIAPGTYIENNPIILPDEISLIGHSLRETTIIPQNDSEDLFYVGNGNYIAEMSFKGTLQNKAVIAFDPTKPRYITQSPYVQNCTNFIPDSIGLKIDGNAAIGPLKSMVLDSYTQYNQGGIGASITNQGYAQLVSLFTICNEIAVYCGSGGACDLTNSNSSFGEYGLVADGVSAKKYSGIVTVASAEQSDTFVLSFNNPQLGIQTASYDNVSGILTVTTTSNHNHNVGMGISISGLEFTCTSGPGIVTYPSGNYGNIFTINQIISNNKFSTFVGTSTLPHNYQNGGIVSINIVRPYDGQALYFNELFYTIKTLNITNGGSGYSTPPAILIDPPSTSWGIRAQAVPIIENGVLIGVDMISNGRGYTSIPEVTISGGINTATATAVLSPEYYTISKSTDIVNNTTIITLNENIPCAVGIGTEVNFFKQSRILATGHSFEFIGSGVEISNAIPFTGGTPPNEDNETDSRNGGLVVYTSTNQSGNFKIGDGVIVNQNTSSITGRSYQKSLLATMTPYILSLGGF